jgi:hypothetical protein
MVRFTASGLVLLGRQGQLLATPLAGLSQTTVESAKQVLKNVAGVPASGIVHFDVAQDGTLVYAERDPHADELDLVWFGPDGKSEPLGVPKAEYSLLRIAPDGRRVAMSIGPGGGRGGDIWISTCDQGVVEAHLRRPQCGAGLDERRRRDHLSGRAPVGNGGVPPAAGGRQPRGAASVRVRVPHRS